MLCQLDNLDFWGKRKNKDRNFYFQCSHDNFNIIYIFKAGGKLINKS